jgi:hypothetical protein
MRTLRLTLLLGLTLAACGDKGEKGDPGENGADGAPGADGADGVPGADGADGADGHRTLTETRRFFEPGNGCDQGYDVTRIGVDDGADGGTADDGALQDGEIDSELVTCLGPDIDEDGAFNLLDNCPEDTNEDQSDIDFDGLGDTCDGTVETAAMWAITRGDQSTSSDLYRYDPANNTATLIGDTGHAIVGIQVNPADGRLYGITRGSPETEEGPSAAPASADVGGCDACLVTIDTTTATATLVTELDIGPTPSLAFLSDGSAYGWTEANDSFVAIDLGDGSTTPLGSGWDSAGHAMGATADDRVYWMNYTGDLFRIPVTTGDPEFLVNVWSGATDGGGGQSAFAPVIEDEDFYYDNIRGDVNASGTWWIGCNGGNGGDGVIFVRMAGPHSAVVETAAVPVEAEFHAMTWAD